MATDQDPRVQRADEDMAELDQQIAAAKDAAAEAAKSNPFPADDDEALPTDPPYQEDDRGGFSPSGA